MSFRIYVSLFVLFGALVAPAQEAVSPKATQYAPTVPVSLSATLLNGRSFKNERFTAVYTPNRKRIAYWFTKPAKSLREKDVPSTDFLMPEAYAGLARTEEHPLCRDLGLGCLVIAYQDSLEMAFQPIGTTQEFSKSLGDEIFLPEMGRIFTCRNNKMPCLPYFKKEGWFDRIKLKKGGAKVADSIEKGILKGKIKAADVVEKMAIATPASFEFLPGIYSRLLKAAPEKASWVSGTIEKALLLTLSALSNSANSKSVSYAFGRDDLIIDGKLLKVDELYQSLKYMKVGDRIVDRWPKIIALTPTLRNELKGFFLDRTTVTNQYKTQAVYLARDNSILLDYTTNFYEALYTLQHELWHAAWEHSSFAQDHRDRLRGLLDATSSEENRKDLQEELAYHTVQNERAAIAQLSLLYHFAGHLTGQWSSVEQASAKAWHESVLGVDEINELFIIKEEREAVTQPLYFTDVNPEWLPGQIYGGLWATKIEAKRQEQKLAREKVRAKFEGREVILKKMDDILKENLPQEMLFMAERYFVQLPNLDSLDTEFSPRKLTYMMPRPVPLTCSDIARVRQALPKGWRYGFPFQFDVVDQRCAKPASAVRPEGNGTHPEGNGTHPEGNGTHPEGNGTHPGISGFPSINAGDTKK